MVDNDLKTITVTIAGRNFPVKVTIEEEQVVQDLSVELNGKINELQDTYPSRDKLDCVIMTLLTYTFDQKKQSGHVDDEIATSKVENIRNLLQTILQ